MRPTELQALAANREICSVNGIQLILLNVVREERRIA